MVEVSIICLVYKSKELAKAVYESVQKYTPKLADGTAEFFFVANDPAQEVVDYLKAKRVPHYININEHLGDEELFKQGFGKPEYMRRVYQGYNYGILKAKGQKIVLINSDNFFSTDWLENLLKYSDYKKVVCSSLIEPGQEKFEVFPFATEKNFGRTLDDFDEAGFQKYAERFSRTGYSSGGVYMPCLLYKDIAVMAGLYPEGNIAGSSFDKVVRYGDEFFYDKLREFGVEHITAKDSIVYHLKEGEKSEAVKTSTLYKAKETKASRLNERLIVHPTNLISYITPEAGHQNIVNELGRKITALIVYPESSEEIEGYLTTINDFDFKNIETVLISDDRALAKQFDKQIRSTYTSDRSYKIMYDLFHRMFGEHLLVMNQHCKYDRDLFDNVHDRDALYYFGGADKVDDHITDYMGNFLFPKEVLVSHTSTFLEFLVWKDKMRVDFSDFKVVDISKRPMPEQPQEEKQSRGRRIAIKAVRKLRRDGLRGLARTAKARLTRL